MSNESPFFWTTQRFMKTLTAIDAPKTTRTFDQPTLLIKVLHTIVEGHLIVYVRRRRSASTVADSDTVSGNGKTSVAFVQRRDPGCTRLVASARRDQNTAQRETVGPRRRDTDGISSPPPPYSARVASMSADRPPTYSQIDLIRGHSSHRH
ncbi:uncharacterized protein KY384_004488 [Bacidia gigantensis]|uniref:uncharacterized protein n=1 Tax=Bacidia gigantensis TaxID=2732470 RepID=UPI001D0529C8|nr:uncharacterized protein KY384_004488 [Bacidia gigantensis]KAG8531130.1 hypothetical protein KY384_004488 [Bacidia gigantensis]